MKVNYVYFDPSGAKREESMPYSRASRSIGDRVLVGFPLINRYVECPDGSHVAVAYFQSDTAGNVWALYYS